MRQTLHRGIASVGDLLPAVLYLAASCGPGASRVRPQTVADLDGGWLMQVVSGTCRQRPALDWRVAAEEFAGVHGARIHAAEYFGTTGTMSLELVWPIDSREMKPDSTAIREAARQRFALLS